MKTLMALSVLMLMVFGSISGPAICRRYPLRTVPRGWDGPQDPSPPGLRPASSGRSGSVSR